MSEDPYGAIKVKLSEPFPPHVVQWKPGATTKDKKRAMAMPYVDSRPYMDRLDDAAPGQWEDRYEVCELQDRVGIVCHLTVAGVTRAGDGECLLVDGKGRPEANAVTSASAQAFKRACAKHGLGRYLYDLPRAWVDYDASKRGFAPGALAQLKEMLVSGALPARRSRPQGDRPPGGDNGPGGGNAAAIEVKFGKHQGKTLGQIAEEDPGYVEWLAGNWKWDQGRQAAAAVLAGCRRPPRAPGEGAPI